jgi:tRNA threonylcarbamoyladenosine modification (KEOPS) complex  Pcc1 subunit
MRGTGPIRPGGANQAIGGHHAKRARWSFLILTRPAQIIEIRICAQVNSILRSMLVPSFQWAKVGARK